MRYLLTLLCTFSAPFALIAMEPESRPTAPQKNIVTLEQKRAMESDMQAAFSDVLEKHGNPPFSFFLSSNDKEVKARIVSKLEALARLEELIKDANRRLEEANANVKDEVGRRTAKIDAEVRAKEIDADMRMRTLDIANEAKVKNLEENYSQKLTTLKNLDAEIATKKDALNKLNITAVAMGQEMATIRREANTIRAGLASERTRLVAAKKENIRITEETAVKAAQLDQATLLIEAQ